MVQCIICFDDISNEDAVEFICKSKCPSPGYCPGCLKRYLEDFSSKCLICRNPFKMTRHNVANMIRKYSGKDDGGKSASESSASAAAAHAAGAAKPGEIGRMFQEQEALREASRQEMRREEEAKSLAEAERLSRELNEEQAVPQFIDKEEDIIELAKRIAEEEETEARARREKQLLIDSKVALEMQKKWNEESSSKASSSSSSSSSSPLRKFISPQVLNTTNTSHMSSSSSSLERSKKRSPSTIPTEVGSLVGGSSSSFIAHKDSITPTKKQRLSLEEIVDITDSP